MLNTEAMSSAHIAYGTIVNDIREVSRSYKEANMALDVGKIFYSDKNVVAYNRLGIGRLIYQLPLPLCQMFIREIFDGKSPDDLDDETLSTINKFLITVLMYRKHQDSYTFIEILLYIGLISFRRQQAWI